jgi:hypothetical protein
VGTHALTAILRSGSFPASTSAVVTETVNPASTTVALTSSANPAVTGQSVTFTATVAAVAPGAGTPTGMVTFKDGTVILATVAVGAGGTATFTTNFATTGNHVITAAYNGDGNFLAGSRTLTETVLPPTTAGATIWSSTTIPANPSNSDGRSVELGVKFRSDVAGSITGIRFYKGAGNTGTHVGYLWSSTGTLLASATFTGETATGWQQVNFSTPVAIAAGTTYIASYLAPAGHFAYNLSYFASSGVDNGVLHALSNTAAGGNGVFLFGSGGFPSQTFNATNYWVDVVFRTTPTPSEMGAGASLAASAARSQAVLGSPGAASSGAASGVAVIGAGAEGNGATNSIAIGTVDSGGADLALDWTARPKTARR